MLKLTLLLLIGIITVPLYAQLGGYGVYKSLQLPPTARVSGLGNYLIGVQDDDPSSSIQNPATLNPLQSGKALLSYNNYISDIGYGTFMYNHDLGNKIGCMQAGIQYISFGSFDYASANGNLTGATFTGSEYTFKVGLGRKFKNLYYGANLKYTLSQLEVYKSQGISVDLGLYYRSKDSTFTYGAVLSHLGFQLITYAGTQERLPLTFDMSFAFKPKHMPLRFSITTHNLQKLDYTYTNPNKPASVNLSNNQTVSETVPFSEKIARHFVIGVELIAGKGFKIQAGYNHQTRKELSFVDSKGLTGFSFGAGLKIRKFQFNYANTTLSLAGSTNMFSLLIDLGKSFGYSKTL